MTYLISFKNNMSVEGFIKEFRNEEIVPYIKKKKLKLEVQDILKDTPIKVLEKMAFWVDLDDGIKGQEKKNLLIKSVYEKLIDENYLADMICITNDVGFENIRSLINKNYVTDEDTFYRYQSYLERGLAYIYVENNTMLLFMPLEIKLIVKRILDEGVNKMTFQEYYDKAQEIKSQLFKVKGDNYSEFEDDSDQMDVHMYLPIQYRITLKEGFDRLNDQEKAEIYDGFELDKKEIKNKNLRLLTISSQYMKSLQDIDLDGVRLLKQLVKDKGVSSLKDCVEYIPMIESLPKLPMTLLVFPGVDLREEPIIVMPEEVIAVLKAINWDEFATSSKKNTEIKEVVSGLCRLYGAIEEKTMFDLLRKHLIIDISKEALDQRLYYLSDFSNEFYELDGYFFYCSVDNRKVLAEALKSRKDLTMKVFTKKEILEAAQPNYMSPNKKLKDFMSFLIKDLEMPKDGAELLGLFISEACLQSNSPTEIIREVSEMMEIDDFELLNLITQKLIEVYNACPQWELKGHSPNELSQRSHKVSPTNVLAEHKETNVIDFQTKRKVGRNDPCPCGSGRKFKHCCG